MKDYKNFKLIDTRELSDIFSNTKKPKRKF